MTDQSEVKTYTEDELKAAIEAATKPLIDKRDELLTETETAKKKASELEELMSKSAEETALKNKEFEKLYNKRDAELRELKAAVDAERQKNKAAAIERYAGGLAATLSGSLGENAVKTATELLARNVEFDEKGEPAFTIGGVRVNTDAMKQHFAEQYPFIVAGAQSTGGGAAKSSGGGAVGGDLDKMTTEQKLAYFRNK